MTPALRQWWDAHNERDQRILQILGGALALLLLWALLWPLHHSVNAARLRVAGKQSDLQWLHSVEPQLAVARPAIQGQGESLLALAGRTARAAGLGNALSSSPNGATAIRVRVEDVGFDNLVGWLAQLQQNYGVNIESATVDALPTAGAVSASLVLQRR